MDADPIDAATAFVNYALNRLGPPPTTDPSVTDWREAVGSSTSAKLRETQAALANSQADLTAMQQQRDEARDEAKQWRAIAEQYLAERDDALHDLAVANRRPSLLTKTVIGPTPANPEEAP